jgi:integrase
MGIRAY